MEIPARLSMYPFILILVSVWMFWGGEVKGQATVTNPANTTPALAATYTSLALAINALNATTAISGPVIITLTANETAPAGGYQVTTTPAGISATNNITIDGNGFTITAYSPQASGIRNDAIFKIIGADYITIQGFVLAENSGNSITALASNTMTEWGIALLRASTTNGAQYNTIRNNFITLSSAYPNSIGIYSNVQHDANGIAGDISSITGSNSYNKIQGNTLGNGTASLSVGIIVIGSVTANYMDIGNEIGGSIQASGNIITNWGSINGPVEAYQNGISAFYYGLYTNNQLELYVSYNTLTTLNSLNSGSVDLQGIYDRFGTSPSSGIFAHNITNNTVTIFNSSTTNPSYGIRCQGLNDNGSISTFNIDNNKIYSNTRFSFTGIYNVSTMKTLNINGNSLYNSPFNTNTTGVFYGIRNNASIPTAININGNRLGDASANFITYLAANSGILYGIANEAAADGCSLSISGNDIQGISQVTPCNGSQYYIWNNSSANISQNISSNTFTNLSINTNCLEIIFIYNRSFTQANGFLRINNNSISGSYTKAASSYSGSTTVTLYKEINQSYSPSTVTHNNNNFSNVTLNTGNAMSGWAANASNPGREVKGNIFSNWDCKANGITVLYVNSGTNTISNNIISTIKGVSSITGILVGAAGTSTLNGNTVSGLSTSGAATVNGISSGVASGTLSKNKICELTGTNAGSLVNGITVSAGSQTLVNNVIGNLSTPAANAANTLNGINITSATASTNVYVYFNTIYLNATSTGAVFGSSGIYHAASATSTTAQLFLRNNIIINSSTHNGTGRTVALRRNLATLANYSALSNNNILFAGGTPGSNQCIYFDGTANDYSTLALFKSWVTPRETASQTENTPFVSTDGTSPYFLHVDPCASPASLAESGAVNIAGFTDDYDGEIRQGNTGYTGTSIIGPDIGADEFEKPTASIVYSPSSYCIDNATPQPVTLTGTGSYTGGTFTASPAGLSISATTGAVTPGASTAGTYTVTYTRGAGTCATLTPTTNVTINALPVLPGLTPDPACAGKVPLFTATRGSIYEFYRGASLEKGPSTSNTYTPGSALNAGEQICVRSITSFTFDGTITEPNWGLSLANSANGAESDIGSNNLDAIYLQSDEKYLYGALAGRVSSDYVILLFIDCIPASGYDDLTNWTNRSAATGAYQSMKNLNNIHFDDGFYADYIYGLNFWTDGLAYWDLYNMTANSLIYGNSSPPSLLGYSPNSGMGDYAKGFEFAIKRSDLGNPTGTIKVFAVIVDKPVGSNKTSLSNQFMTKANYGESSASYGTSAIDFRTRAPNPVSYTLLTTGCYAQKCVTNIGTVWTGTANTDWSNDANWCSEAAPLSTTDVLIPNTVARYPEVNITGAECKNLVIYPSPASLQVNAGQTLTVSGNSTNNGTLTIQSDALGNNGSLIVNGNSSGNVTYNRYLETDRWFIISSPVNTSSGGFDGSQIIHYPGIDYDLAPYIETDNEGWRYYTEGNLPSGLASGQAYMARVSGTGILKFTGPLNNSDVTIPVFNTPSTADGLYKNGWNAIGNPFTSAIGITNMAGTGQNFLEVNSGVLETNYNAVYLWNQTGPYNYGVDQYYKVINNSGYYWGNTYGGVITENYIQAGQGFLVNAGNYGGNIKFSKGTSGMQTHKPLVTMKSQESSWPGITLLAIKDGHTRYAEVAFNNNMTTGLDETYDAGLLPTSEFNLYTRLVSDDNETKFTIQCLPDDIYDSLFVPVGIDLPLGGMVTIKATGVILPEGIFPVIEDRLLQVSVPLKTEDDSLTVFIGEPTWGTDRFYLHFGKESGTVDNKPQHEARKLIAIFNNQKITIFGVPEEGSRAWLYDINGRKSGGEYRLTSANKNEIPAMGLINGIYFLRIEEKASYQTIKVTVLKN